MKKIKKLWQKNKIVIVLISILIACFIAICFITLTYFFGGSGSSYGDRLDGIESYKLSNSEVKEMRNKVLENSLVDDFSIKLKGKIYYLKINTLAGTSVEDAKEIASSSSALFSEEELSYFDLNYTISSDDVTVMGYKGSSQNDIEWNNYLVKEDVEE